MNFKYILSTTFVFLTALVFATSGSTENSNQLIIEGVVKDQNNQPVIFASVQVLGTVKGTTTNTEGYFAIYNLDKGDYSVKISSVGFKSITKTVNVNGELVKLDIVFEEDLLQIPPVTVIANKDRLLSNVPGSVTFMEEKELQRIQPISGNEVFRRIPGLNVVDEEGLGMRVNIGVRGLDPDRSRSVLMLEDGVPIALAPYGEPEMYYTPSIDRMSGVEVLKGSGQILYGPQTIGGVVNYITALPTDEQSIGLKIQGGEGSYFSGLASYSNTFGNTGVYASLLKKSADKVGITGFDIIDFTGKVIVNLNDQSSLAIKASVYDETSNATYIGLTQTMYNAGQYFQHMAPEDELAVRRYGLSLNHSYQFAPNVTLRTLAYGYTTTRNWRRQDFAMNTTSNNKPANWTGVVWGDENVVGGAVFMRNSTGNRDRQFEVAGIEPKIEVNYDLFGAKNELIGGVRFLYERANEQRINGTKYNVSSGNLIEDEVRTGNAISAYLQNETNISKKLAFTYGVRFEHFDYERDIARRNFSINGANVLRDTSLIRGNQLSQFIPGAGFNWRPNVALTLFGGLHRGFAPPRVKDAISNVGEVYELAAESSWNYELGLRTDLIPGVFLELTGFYMDFSNQIIPVSVSSGSTGVGLVNAGATFHRGVESAILVDLARLIGLKKIALTYDASTTFTNARFQGQRFAEGIDVSGNRTPYAPGILLNQALNFETNAGFGFRLTGNYTGEQFTDELNTRAASANGREGLIPSFHVWDAQVSYLVRSWDTRFNISLKNITDERYIASRRPEGIRVGLPRFITAGIDVKF